MKLTQNTQTKHLKDKQIVNYAANLLFEIDIHTHFCILLIFLANANE